MRWTGLSRATARRRSRHAIDYGRWLEGLLVAILLIQLARLVWALATPVGLFGDWRARQPVIVGADARRALFAGFDPFFRAESPGQGSETAQVTSLALQLFGTRMNEGSGQGSAIIAGSDGVQASYAVGEEIAPGVRLKAVGFDHVVIERGGVEEKLFIEQSASSPDTGIPPADGTLGLPETPGVGPNPGKATFALPPADGRDLTPGAMPPRAPKEGQ